MEADKVIGINSKSNTVDYLEKLLTHAKNGEVVGMASVIILNDGNIMDGYIGIDNDVLTAIAGLRILEHRIMKVHVEMPEDT